MVARHPCCASLREIDEKRTRAPSGRIPYFKKTRPPGASCAVILTARVPRFHGSVAARPHITRGRANPSPGARHPRPVMCRTGGPLAEFARSHGTTRRRLQSLPGCEVRFNLAPRAPLPARIAATERRRPCQVGRTIALYRNMFSVSRGASGPVIARRRSRRSNRGASACNHRNVCTGLLRSARHDGQRHVWPWPGRHTEEPPPRI